MKKVIKRDGKEESFDAEKIRRVIKLANSTVSKEKQATEEDIQGILESVLFEISNEENDEKIEIEKIQDLVEKELMEEGFYEIAKSFIIFREERSKERFRKLQITKDIKIKLDGKKNDRQNANVDEDSFGGRKGEADSVLNKQLALDYYISPKFAKNHINNRIYIHDLDSYVVGMHNCLSIPFDNLLKNGFNTRQTDIRPASSINTAFQLVAVIFQLQSLQQFGGVSATHLDWTMVPYVRMSFWKHYKEVRDILPFTKEEFDVKKEEAKDVSIDDVRYVGKRFDFTKRYIAKKALSLTIKELNQAVEGMYHNLNTLQSRSGNQLPFTSINYGTCTSKEGRIVIEALLQGSLKGVGKLHKTAIFPCGIFQKMKGVNDKGSPNYDLYKLAIKSTTRRLYPNYANVDWSGNAGYDINDPRTYFSTMGCRTANGYDINGFGQLKDGRGNIAPATIILPTLAMEAKKKAKDNPEYIVDYFMDVLKTAISDCKDQLIERFEWICAQNSASAKFMYENNTMVGYIPEEGIRSALKHGTLAIGQIGIAETLQILVGCDQTTEKGMEIAKQIEQLFKDKCSEYKNNYKLNFGVYYTPAENLCYTAMMKFQKKYGKIENVSDHDYFTNSIHVPVWKKMSPFEKIDIESKLTGYSSAGCITYVELDDSAKNNEKAVEQIVDYAMEHDIPYFAINVPNDICNNCGFTDEINDECPMCHSKDVSHLRRVTGYLTGDYKTAFNHGKQKETEDREKHSKYWIGWNK